ncbi:Tetratricopeptide repeat protein 28 [Stylophora pistillata]|uniref:Tetratricopeptide repeat protein 28 n=1 Tax=Stylophora pistillata TaxID=50429 RepID=A0A2B4RTG0_STYPI|nr:Tetratricopeptide repeat protein 28 [Stylophora pistillata]
MSSTAEILEAVRISLDVAIILLKTDHGLKATEFCNKCVSLLQHFDSGTHLEISEDIINAYCAIFGNTNAARHNATKLLNELHRAGILTIQLGDKFHEQSQFEEAKQAFESALTIMKMTGRRREEAVAQGRLGVVSSTLGEGVLELARAFLASGARSLLVASWAIEDKAAAELMKHFYKHLVRGESASESLHQAINWLRSNGFPKPFQWAPYMLIGDYVTFDFTKIGFGCFTLQSKKVFKVRVVFLTFGFISHTTGISNTTLLFEKERSVMSYTAGILEAVRISLDVAIILLKTDRALKATEFCNKCVSLLQNFDSGTHLKISEDIINVYCTISGYTNEARYNATKLLDKLHRAGILTIQLGDKYHEQSRFEEAKRAFESALAIMKTTGHSREEAVAHGKLGVVNNNLKEKQKAIEHHKKALGIAIEIGDRQGEGASYRNLGSVYFTLSEYQTAKEYHDKALAIAIEIGDKEKEVTSNRNLGILFRTLGKNQTAKEHYEKALAITIEIGDRKRECASCLSLGSIYCELEKYWQAKKYFDKALNLSIQTGDKTIEAGASVGLATVFAFVEDKAVEKAKEHCEKALAITRECGNRAIEVEVYLSVGNLNFRNLDEYDKGEDYLQKARSISIEIGDKLTEFQSLYCIANLKRSQSKIEEAKQYLFESIRKYEQVRSFQKGNEEFKISLLEKHGTFPLKMLTKLFCNTGEFRNALYVEELGRARSLTESMAHKFSVEIHFSADPKKWIGIENIGKKERNCDFLYISYYKQQVYLWILKVNGDIFFRATDKVEVHTLYAEGVCDVEGIFKNSAACFGVLPSANCEDRPLDDNKMTSVHEESRVTLRGDETKATESRIHHLCYKWIIAPVADLLTEPEIVIVPDRFLYRVPFAALRDEPTGKYLSENYRIRIIPSLTTLWVIQECPVDYHKKTGALVVGDPTVGRVHYNGSVTDVIPLFGASMEARMVGEVLNVAPLLGKCATKQAVLQALPSVSLIHIAAHGSAERGEIPLAPQSTTNSIPQEADYLLTMSDISRVQVPAKLVVLSCCHSARGLIKEEGVLGLARAFLASGARSVLVAEWASQDQGTAELMKHFYKHLVRGESASESLHQAMNWVRSNGFNRPSQWAPFVLIGDNVTFDFTKIGLNRNRATLKAAIELVVVSIKRNSQREMRKNSARESKATIKQE